MRTFLICCAAALTLGASSSGASAAYTCRLNPYGDNFLSLRTGPGSGFPEIDRMGPNTSLVVLDARGAWRYVRTSYGLVGWAYSAYICG